MQDRVSNNECKATTRHLCSEADVAWKEMHEVMYNHQLHYDRLLTTFLTDVQMALDDMQDKVWDAIHALAENEGITFDACLGLVLQVLNLLLQIPIDILFHMQIPLTIAYCPESSVYRRCCPEQGGVSPLCKEIRAFHTLSKVLGGVTHQPSESAGGPPSPAPSDHSAESSGSAALDIDLVAMHKASLLPTAGDQTLQAQWPAVIPFIPLIPKMARCQAVSLITPKMREMVLKKRTMPRKTRAGLRPQVTDRRHPMVKISRSVLIPWC